jgi:hypothetical protein
MATADSKTANNNATTCKLEVWAGAVGQSDHVDGPLLLSRFTSPTHLCVWKDSLIVANFGGHTVRLIDGELLVEPAAGSSKAGIGGGHPQAARISAAVVAAAPGLLKELAAIVADYARPIGVRTIAGSSKTAAFADGHALREAKFTMPSGVAVDDTDPVAGPQLIISDYSNHCIRSLNLRTEQVTTIAGGSKKSGHKDGKAVDALFGGPICVVIDPATGVLFVAEQV